MANATSEPSPVIATIPSLVVLIALASLFLDTTIYSGSLSELHINYSAGFIRRGLLGSIALYLEHWKVIEPVWFFKIVFAMVYALMVLLTRCLLQRWKRHGDVELIIMFSPALLLFPFFDVGAFMRKDAFVSLGILIHAFAWLNCDRYEKFVGYVLVPLLSVITLIYEVQVFYLGFHLLLVWRKLRNQRLVACVFLLPLLIGAGSALINVSPNDVQLICNSWLTPPECHVIEPLSWSLKKATSLNAYYFVIPSRFFYMVVLCFASLLPTFLVIRRAGRASARISGATNSKNFQLFMAAAICCPLFILGYDWGRWIHVMAIHTLAVSLVILVPAPKPFLNNRWNILMPAGLALYIASWRLPHAGVSWSAIFDESLAPRVAWMVVSKGSSLLY